MSRDSLWIVALEGDGACSGEVVGYLIPWGVLGEEENAHGVGVSGLQFERRSAP